MSTEPVSVSESLQRVSSVTDKKTLNTITFGYTVYRINYLGS